MLYVSASRIVQAGRVLDRTARVRQMAETMREAVAADGACTLAHLRAAGFSTAEAFAFADDARELLSDRKAATPKPARTAAFAEATALVARARTIRRRVRKAERVS